MCRQWVYAREGSQFCIANLLRSNLTMKSVVALIETKRCNLHRYSAVRCIQYSGMNFSTLAASSRQYRPKRMSPWDWSFLARSYLMTGMKSSMLIPDLNLLKMMMIDLVFTPSMRSCSQISFNFAFKEASILGSPCVSAFLIFICICSFSMRRVFSSGLFHSAMICFNYISQWSGQRAFMAAPASWSRSQELLSTGRSKQESIIFLWQRAYYLRGGQISSCQRPDQSHYTSKYYSSVTIFFRESNILLRPISSADFWRLNSCRHSWIDHTSLPLSNYSKILASYMPEGTHSSKMVFASERSTFPIFFSQISQGKTSLPPLPLPSCFSSCVSCLMKLQRWSMGNSYIILRTKLSNRAYMWGYTRSTPGLKNWTKSEKLDSLSTQKNLEKYLRVSCWMAVSLFPQPSQRRCSLLHAFMSYNLNLSPVNFLRTIVRISADLSLILINILSILWLLSAILVRAIFLICSLSSVDKILNSSCQILSRSSCCQPRTREANLIPTCLQVDTFSRNKKKTDFSTLVRVYEVTVGRDCLTRWNIILAEVILMPKMVEKMPSAKKLRKQLKNLPAGPSSSASTSAKSEPASCQNLGGILRLAFSWKILKIFRYASSKAVVKFRGSSRNNLASSNTCAFEAV